MDLIWFRDSLAYYSGIPFIRPPPDKEWQGINVLIESDNTASIAYIKKRCGTRNNAMPMLSRTIWEWALRKEIHLLATHRPGVRNVEADRESRVLSRECAEWSLDSRTASCVLAHFGKPEVDLFASRLNNKLPRYYALNFDRCAARIDCFAQSWSGIFGYSVQLDRTSYSEDNPRRRQSDSDHSSMEVTELVSSRCQAFPQTPGTPAVSSAPSG
ncbi:hypothetical protein Aduo_000828 [Ancylostoma duodenale]